MACTSSFSFLGLEVDAVSLVSTPVIVTEPRVAPMATGAQVLVAPNVALAPEAAQPEELQ